MLERRGHVSVSGQQQSSRIWREGWERAEPPGARTPWGGQGRAGPLRAQGSGQPGAERTEVGAREVGAGTQPTPQGPQAPPSVPGYGAPPRPGLGLCGEPHLDAFLGEGVPCPGKCHVCSLPQSPQVSPLPRPSTAGRSRSEHLTQGRPLTALPQVPSSQGVCGEAGLTGWRFLPGSPRAHVGTSLLSHLGGPLSPQLLSLAPHSPDSRLWGRATSLSTFSFSRLASAEGGWGKEIKKSRAERGQRGPLAAGSLLLRPRSLRVSAACARGIRQRWAVSLSAPGGWFSGLSGLFSPQAAGKTGHLD